MEPDVIEVRPLPGYRLWVLFEDGTSGTISLEDRLQGPMFSPLRDEALFSKVFVHPDLGVVTWPNGADLAPEFTYRNTH